MNCLPNIKPYNLRKIKHLRLSSAAVVTRRMDTPSGEATLSKLVCIPSEKGSTLKGKNLLP